jgi:sarcosine oxidase
MDSIFDVAVLGLGGMGSAAAWALARRGARVVGLEQFDLAHDRGSSHGETRLIRKAYFEHPDYVPLLHRSYALWDELGALAESPLLHRAGLVLCGAPESDAVAGAELAAERHALALEPQPAGRFRPLLDDRAGERLLVEPEGGYVEVDRAVRAFQELAQRDGATLLGGTPVTGWTSEGALLRLSTPRGDVVARRLVLAAGAWSGRWLAELGVSVVAHRNLLFWFDAGPEWRDAPCFVFDLPEGFFYGFPRISERGLKVAQHLPGEVVAEPSEVDRALRPEDVAPVARFVAARLSGVDPAPREHVVCLYEMSADGHFVITLDPRDARVAIAAGFSGHGFKFAPVVGEALADLALEGRTDLPIGFLGLGAGRIGAEPDPGR